MKVIKAADFKQFADALGPGGLVSAKRFFPQFEDSLVDVGEVAGSSVTRKDYGDGVYNRTVLTFTNRSQSMTDEAGVVAYGGSKVFDMPEGNIQIFGATANLTVTKSGAGINADFDGDFSVGTVTASNNATLSSTEQNIIPTTATPQAVAGATTAKGINIAAIAPLDGTATPVDIYLNFLIDDADQDITGGGASSLLYSGTLTICWVNLGDK